MASKKAASDSKPSKSQAKPQNLAPKNGTAVKGGLRYELKNVMVSSYSIG